VIAGGASKRASEQMRQKVARIVADQLECADADIELRDGAAWVRGSDVKLSLAKLARMAHHSSHLLPAGESPSLAVTGSYDPSGTFSNACHAVEVEVDPARGSVIVTRFVVAEDAGVLVNPAIVDGQVHGGIAQGIANALYEELIYDERGILVTTSLMDYLPPTMHEMPHIEIHHLQTLSDATITGAKGVGEGGTIGAPAAILNAICDALAPLGIDLFHIPATPHIIRRAIRNAEADREAAAIPTRTQGVMP
jgi:carbon-monoxide dehydrogenase large subunit